MTANTWMRRLALGVGATLAGVGGAVTVAAVSSAGTAPSVITGGQTLPADSQLESPDGHYQLIMLSNGSLAEYDTDSGRLIFSTDTSGSGNYAVLEPSGPLVVDSSSGSQLWTDNATTSGCPALNVLDDGEVTVEGPSSEAWSSGVVSTLDGGDLLEPGQVLYSPNEDYELQMQADGDLVLYNSSMTVLWQSNTSGSGNYAEVTTAGDFAVYSSSGSVVWDTGTSSAGDYLYLQPDGNLVLYPSNNGAAVWASNTSTGEGSVGPGTGDIAPVPQYGSSSACASGSGAAGSGTPGSSTSSSTVPTAPSTTVVTVTVPQAGTTKSTKKLRALHFRVELHFAWRNADSYLSEITFGKVPHGLHWKATVTPERAGAKVKRRTANTRKQLHGLIVWLEHQRYRVGDTLRLSISRRGYRTESYAFRMRLHALPEELGAKPKTRTGRR